MRSGFQVSWQVYTLMGSSGPRSTLAQGRAGALFGEVIGVGISGQNPSPPPPHPEAERGEEDFFCSPSPLRGGGRGEGLSLIGLILSGAPAPLRWAPASIYYRCPGHR